MDETGGVTDLGPAGPVVAAGSADLPAAVGRTAPARALTVVGTVAAALGVVCAALGLSGFLSFAETGEGWPVTSLVSAVVMLLICATQVLLWRRAAACWRGARPAPAQARVSWWLHLTSYVVALGALVGGMYGSAASAWTTTAAVWLTGSMVLVISAQVLGGVQHVRTDGPPGTIPTHLRRLAAWTAEQRRPDLD